MAQLISAINGCLYRWELVAALSVFMPFVLTYIYTTWTAITTASSKAWGARNPPTLPYSIPFLGHALSFMSDGHRAISDGV
jgi:hypothetical protein